VLVAYFFGHPVYGVTVNAKNLETNNAT